MEKQTSGYIPSLDGLRAVAILIVFLAHAEVSDMIPGGLGVTVFFFLSGFLITTLLTRERDRYGNIAVGAFYLRRLLRLTPPLLLALAAAVVLDLAGFVPGSLSIGTFFSQLFFYFNYYELFADPATFSMSVEGLDILWSLSVEEHFYLIWPALFILISAGKLGTRSVVVLLVAILLWRAIRFHVLHSSEWAIYVSTDTRFDSLLYGCLLALMVWRGQAGRLFGESLRARSLWIAAGIGLLLVTLLVRDEAFRSVLRYSVQGLALMPIFYYAVHRPDDLLFQPLNWRWVRQIGLWSYTLYLFHFVVIKGLIAHGIGTPGSPLFVLLAAVPSVAFAAAVYHWVERPLKPLRARIEGHHARRRAVPAPAPEAEGTPAAM